MTGRVLLALMDVVVATEVLIDVLLLLLLLLL